ncbi:SMP-30/gluconolactonase/LRE family protein [Nocardia sp. 004]|uniref:SMP-30/gluconolactonase/LRE family protein n=1 Tax=Nocardia sp. 004 TaxID=3385978 RepID=UPI0039A1F9F8
MRTFGRRGAVRCSVLGAVVAGVLMPVATAEVSVATAEISVGSCAPAVAVTAIPTGVPVLDWSENMGYDAQGNLWVSRLYRNEVQRYDATGRVTATVPVELPGAVRLGPDGLLYVVYGDAPSSAVRPGGVLRFDPAAANPEPEVFVSGFTMPNGAAFDPSGDLYVATMSGVVRVRPDASIDTAWGAQAAVPAANGIAVHQDMLYVTTNGGPLGRIIRIPIAAPAERGTVAQLSARLPGLPDFADDLLADPAGILYVTTITGQLVRVDPVAGEVCTVLDDQPMTAVTAVPGRQEELLASTVAGAILRIHLSN